MEKQNIFYQFKSKRLWKDSVAIGFAIFGVVSAILGVLGVSFSEISDNVWIILLATIASLIFSYLAAVVWQWWNIKDNVTLKIRGINVTVRQGDIFKEKGWKVIGVDDNFSTSEDDMIISHSSLHGQLIKQLKQNGEIEAFKTAISKDSRDISLGCVKTYNDYILLALTRLNSDNEAHTDNTKYESTLRKMWQEIGRIYSGKPIYLPILGDGIIRFDGVSEKPSPFELLRCMLCTLKTSNIQLKAPITIVIYDRINEINFYNLKGFNTL
ncbi:macro domain-containing protein [Lachnoclostridium phytofermentans]|uniref:macro domain-containing protein n=1 Tax=Lachnoclostridium phytofermentans TaxID=66219 RepID=UPI00068DB1CB|nr:macro domain-containing protein [Lachnoclostridium phytofermentans]